MQSDADFLGLSGDPDVGRFHFAVRNHLARLDGRLYGGTAIAVSITAAELVSGRTAVWMTTQFVATAPPDEEISVLAEVLAPGRRTNQVRVTGTNPAGEIMFASLGATGHHSPDAPSEVFEHVPTVDPADESGPWAGPFAVITKRMGLEIEMPKFPDDVGFAQVLEFREPQVHHHPDPGPGRLCIWVRRRDGGPIIPAIVAYIADMVPLSISDALGVIAIGISLDNSIRLGVFEETEWVLVDLRPHLAVGDYGHGTAHVWSERGHLLATASQSTAMKRIDMATAATLNWLPKP